MGDKELAPSSCGCKDHYSMSASSPAHPTGSKVYLQEGAWGCGFGIIKQANLDP